MAESFNSIQHAEAFLKKRGLHIGLWHSGARDYILLHDNKPFEWIDREAVRYLYGQKRYATLNKSMIYIPKA